MLKADSFPAHSGYIVKIQPHSMVMVTAQTGPRFCSSMPLKFLWAGTWASVGIGTLLETPLMFNKYQTAALISLSSWKGLRAVIRPFNPGYVFNTWPYSRDSCEGSSVIAPTGTVMFKLLAHLPKSLVISEWSLPVNVSWLLLFAQSCRSRLPRSLELRRWVSPVWLRVLAHSTSSLPDVTPE